MPMQRLVCILLAIALLIVSARAEGDEASGEQELVAELLANLNTFAKTHDLNHSQMRDLLGEVVLNGRNFKKGGVGLVSGDVFVIVDGARNEIVLANKRWEGRPASEPEVVLTDGRRVLCAVPGADSGELRVVFFSPTEVRYIDQTTKSSGVYLRRSPQSP
jgi:hypothetical protein